MPAWPFYLSAEEDRMIKIDIVNRIADETGLTKVKAEQAVDAILEEIKDGLQRGEPVTLRRFGSFEVRDKRARMGRNPKTGEEAGIPARRIVRFKSGKHFKESVNDSSYAQR
jgi:DNA-binding protein HU-beta